MPKENFRVTLALTRSQMQCTQLGVRVSIRVSGLYNAWHSMCVFSASIAPDFFPPPIFKIYLKAAAGREMVVACYEFCSYDTKRCYRFPSD